MSDLISRQALCEYALNKKYKCVTPNDIMRFPSANITETEECKKCQETVDRVLLNAKRGWIPVEERLPEDLEEVNVTWINTDPEPYYDFLKGKPFTGSAVYYKGRWYWYSSTTKDMLAEYGRYDSEEFDEAIECIAWMPLPEPYKGVTE